MGIPKVFTRFFGRGALLILKTRKPHTVNGKNCDKGNLMKNTSLNLLIRKCADFMNKKTMLQYMGEKLGAIIDRNPKCTPELAG